MVEEPAPPTWCGGTQAAGRPGCRSQIVVFRERAVGGHQLALGAPGEESAAQPAPTGGAELATAPSCLPSRVNLHSQFS